MYNIPSINTPRYMALTATLEYLVPSKEQGTWTLSCCKAVVPAEHVILSNYGTRAKAKCSACVMGYDTWGPDKKGYIQYSGDEKNGYRSKDNLWGSARLTTTQITEKVSGEGCEISPIYDNHEVYWSEQDRYDTINNILEQLRGELCGYEPLRTRHEFSETEIDFLKDRGLLEHFQETMLIVQCHALRMTRAAFNEIQTRMTSAGQCLSFGGF
jgi:hypothetical protein